MTEAAARISSRRVDLPDIAATELLARRLAARARIGDVIGLRGPLGAGKTTFARAFIGEIARLSGESVDDVPSPTFTLVQTYEFARATVFHLDLYRIARPEEAWELGIEEAFASGVTLIEWPERLGALLPGDRVEVMLRSGATPNARIAEIALWGADCGHIFALDADD